MIMLSSCIKEDTTEDTTEEEPEITRFCWSCVTNIYQKNYECGTLISHAGSMYNVSKTTKCGMTEEEIRKYEIELSSFSSVVLDATLCGQWDGYSKKMYTKEITITCTKKE